MKIITSITLLFLAVTISAQNNSFKQPNYKSIEKNIKKKKSVFFYPTLFKKFISSDTSFTLAEKRHLYYGYSFNENYSPYGSSSFKDSVFSVFDHDT